MQNIQKFRFKTSNYVKAKCYFDPTIQKSFNDSRFQKYILKGKYPCRSLALLNENKKKKKIEIASTAIKRHDRAW